MATPARSKRARDASRRNGARSKGPRTASGKRRSARNALKHGLRAAAIVDPAMMPDWIRQLEAEVLEMLGTPDYRQRELVDLLLLACLQLDQADQMIDNRRAQFAVHLAELDGESQVVAEHLDGVAGQLAEIGRLHAYRRRFRGRRDRLLARLFRRGLPQKLSLDCVS